MVVSASLLTSVIQQDLRIGSEAQKQIHVADIPADERGFGLDRVENKQRIVQQIAATLLCETLSARKDAGDNRGLCPGLDARSDNLGRRHAQERLL